jgi:hypothetical protein
VIQAYLEFGVESLLDEGGFSQVPIYLPTGVEREAVLDSAFMQICKLIDMLPASA